MATFSIPGYSGPLYQTNPLSPLNSLVQAASYPPTAHTTVPGQLPTIQQYPAQPIGSTQTSAPAKVAVEPIQTAAKGPTRAAAASRAEALGRTAGRIAKRVGNAGKTVASGVGALLRSGIPVSLASVAIPTASIYNQLEQTERDMNDPSSALGQQIANTKELAKLGYSQMDDGMGYINARTGEIVNELPPEVLAQLGTSTAPTESDSTTTTTATNTEVPLIRPDVQTGAETTALFNSPNWNYSQQVPVQDTYGLMVPYEGTLGASTETKDTKSTDGTAQGNKGSKSIDLGKAKGNKTKSSESTSISTGSGNPFGNPLDWLNQLLPYLLAGGAGYYLGRR